MIALAGIVKIHAQIILPAIPQRTALGRCDEPTPTIAPVIVCVVDTGIPNAVAVNNVIAPPDSAQKPPIGLSLVSRCPMVFTIRHPPNIVPKAMVV